MNNTITLLDKAKGLCSPQTDYELAKRLGISPQRISNCRRGKATLDNEAAFKLAKLLRLPATDVVAYFEEDRAKDPHKKEFWRQQLPRVLPSIAIGTALLLAVGGTLIDGQPHGVGITGAFNILLYPVIHYAH